MRRALAGEDLQAEADSAAAALEARYADAADDHHRQLKYAVRSWSVRHARGLSRFYALFESLLATY